MKTKRTTRTTEITVERDEVHVIRRVGKRKLMWCAECGREAQVMTPDEAVAFAGGDGRKLSELVKNGVVHLAEQSGGSLLICVNSLC